MANDHSGRLSGNLVGAGPFTSGDGRRFGFPVGTAFLLLTGVLVWRGHVTAAYSTAAAGSVLILAALVMPARLGPVHRAWMALALAMSTITTPVIMGLLYFLVVTPIGVLKRTIGGNPLRRPAADSYWVKRATGKRSDLRRQF